MALVLPSLTSPSTLFSQSIHLSSRPSFLRIRASIASSSSMSSQAGEFPEFPFASPPVRDLMTESVVTVERRLDCFLKPCELPSNVRRYSNQSGTADGSLYIRSGTPNSPIDFVLGSWLHCKLPTGAALNISSLSCYLNDRTDSPHFLMELIQSSDESMVFILDLVPRKDLVLHPHYLQVFYEDTGLEKQRQILEKIPQIQPYISSSLYIRSVVSPTAILVRADSKDTGGGRRLEEIIRDNVSLVTKEVLGVWLDQCVDGKREVGDGERRMLKERDNMYKSKTLEIDLVSNLPRLFGQETADRVLEVLRNYF